MNVEGRRREDRLARRVGRREQRKLHARRRAGHGVWFGIGMYGLVGWSVAVPTLLGVLAGVWIDDRYPSRFSWTLMLLGAGLLVGCSTAWYWVSREQRAIGEERRDLDDEGAGDG